MSELTQLQDRFDRVQGQLEQEIQARMAVEQLLAEKEGALTRCESDLAKRSSELDAKTVEFESTAHLQALMSDFVNDFIGIRDSDDNYFYFSPAT